LLLAQTVETLRDQRYEKLPNPTARNRQLAKDADVSSSQIERVIAGTLGTSVDTIDALAKALDVRPQDLLTPYFASKHLSDQLTASTPSIHEPRPSQEREPLRRRQSG
jgi:transcriptional regulator with XRE-family HTH domain